MPYKDENGDEVGKGDTTVQTRTVSVTDTATIVMNDLVSITNILGTQTEGEASVDESNNAAADAVQGTEDNEVDVTLYTGGGVDTLDTTTNQTQQIRDVTVVAEGY